MNSIFNNLRAGAPARLRKYTRKTTASNGELTLTPNHR